jgi:BirA family biotin operon repressor/biotin-[acetyl-CoA-carboxylase] ligase
VNRAPQPDAELDALVLGLLVDGLEGGAFVSGQALADKLDLDKPVLLQRFDSLRARGYALQAVPGAGYRLVGMPEAPTRSAMEPLLTTVELGRRLEHHPAIGSTNDEAHRLADEGAPHGTLVLAEEQTQGRGRRGRAWVSPPGKGLALSLVLRPQLSAAQAPELQLVAAVALCETARELGVQRAAIKWPNDLECEGRKLAGLLAELRVQGERLQHVVLGIGLNVNVVAGDLPPELRRTASSLALERGGPLYRCLVLARLLWQLERWLALHEAEGFAPVRERWKQLSSTLGQRVRVETGRPGGEAGALLGVATDLAEDGALLLCDDQGREHKVMAGDVEHLRPAQQGAEEVLPSPRGR